MKIFISKTDKYLIDTLDMMVKNYEISLGQGREKREAMFVAYLVLKYREAVKEIKDL